MSHPGGIRLAILFAGLFVCSGQNCVPVTPQTQTTGVTSPFTCAGNTFSGDIGGVQATAVLTFEEFRDYTLWSGQINSGPYVYTFTADVIGDRGWGDMVDHFDNSRFRIQIDVLPDGFLLTSNPFLQPTTYTFVCQ